MLNPARQNGRRADFGRIAASEFDASAEMRRTGAWMSHEDVADAAELIGHAVVGTVVSAFAYNLALAQFASAHTRAMLAFAQDLGRASGPADVLVLSNAHATDRVRAVHRHAGELAGLAQAALNDISKPYRTRAILGYGVVR